MHIGRAVAIAATAAAVALIALALPAEGTSGQSPPTTPPTTRAPKSGGAATGAEPVVNSWALAPTGSDDPSQPGNRPNLSYEAAPGATIEDSVTLFNYSNVQLTFRIYATDAFNNADGHFDLLPADKAPTGAGTWVTFPQANITVPSMSQASMPITIAVPADARPGDHAGAVVASSQAQGSGPDGKVISLDRRTGSRLYIRVAGPLAPELAVAAVETQYRPALNPLKGRVEVAYRVENRGNVRLAASQQVSISGPFGVARKTKPTVEVPELLPGEGFTVRATFEGAPATGLLATKIQLDPLPVVGGGAEELEPKSWRSTTLAVPLTLLALALSAFLVRYARRSYRRHGEQLRFQTPGP